MAFYIGIDSGGTHIVAQAFTLDGQQLDEEIAGQGNIIINETETIANLNQVIEAIISRHSDDTCAQILIGIAGIETSGLSATLEKKFTKKYGVKTTVMSDAKLALLNGLEGNDGALVISGTGSVVYGRQRENVYRVGGYGNLLGDNGSAYSIVRSAVIEALEKQDRLEESELAEVLSVAFGVKNIEQVKRLFYQLDRKEIASKALFVAKAADANNNSAIKILAAEAEALAEQVKTLLSLFDQPIPTKIALSGSVLLKNILFQEELVNSIKEKYPQIEVTTIKTNNARGVLYLDKWTQEEK